MVRNAVELLLLVDNSGTAQKMERVLNLLSDSYRITYANDEVGFKKQWDSGHVAIVLYQHGLKSLDAELALKYCTAAENPVPFILLAHRMSAQNAIGWMRKGASDIVLEQVMDELPQVLIRLLSSDTAHSGNLNDSRPADERNSIYQAIFRAPTASMVIVADRRGNIVEWNTGAETAFGHSASDVVGRPLSLIIPERYRTLHKLGLEQAVATGTLKHAAKSMQIVGLRKSGEEFPLEIAIGSMRTDDHRYFCAIMLDKTESAATELRLQQGRTRLIEAQKIGHMGHYRYDIKSQEWFTSSELRRIFGIDKDFKRDYNSWLLIVHPDQRQEMADYMQVHVLQQHNEFDRSYRIIAQDTGMEKWVHGQGQLRYDEQGEVVEMFGIIQDITEHKHAELALLNIQQELKASEQKFRQVFEKSADAILIIENRIFVDCNEATVKMLKYNEKALILNLHPSELSPKKQPDGQNSYKKAEKMMQTAIDRGAYRFEWVHTRKNGEEFPVEVLLTAISNDPGHEIIHCVWRDITDRKATENALQETLQNMESLVQERVKALKEATMQLKASHNDLLSSLRYAKLIQGASIPSDKELRSVFRRCFTLYLPSNIVSGDFYWFHAEGDEVIVAMADCTGHGVPGAMMSMAGHEQLGNIIIRRRIRRPDFILEQMDESMTDLLKRKDARFKMSDGMDMSVVLIDRRRNLLSYAGAQSHGIMIHDGIATPLTPDRISIGGLSDEQMKDFSLLTFDFSKGDRFYLFSDGIYDQFGGPKGKKWMRKEFTALLLDTAHLSMAQQKNHLHKAFSDWKGDNEQVDDITVIGFEL